MSLESQIEVMNGSRVQAYAASNLKILNDIDNPVKNWQPSDLLPDITRESDELALARKQVAGLSPDVLVVLIGDMITEEGLPTYMSLLNRTPGFADETGTSEKPFATWTRYWTAEENRHGDALNLLLRLNKNVNMRAVETTTQHLIASGFDNRAGSRPYEVAHYTSFQEWATMLSHNNVAKLAQRDGDELTFTICRRIAGDEARHERFYSGLMQVLLDEDPNGAMLAIRAMVDEGIVMPAEKMVENRKVADGQEMKLYDRFARVAGRLGIYTSVDYVTHVGELVKQWDLGNRVVVGAAAEAQDYLATYRDKKIRGAEILAARLKKTQPQPFAWIHGKAA